MRFLQYFAEDITLLFPESKYLFSLLNESESTFCKYIGISCIIENVFFVFAICEKIIDVNKICLEEASYILAYIILG